MMKPPGGVCRLVGRNPISMPLQVQEAKRLTSLVRAKKTQELLKVKIRADCLVCQLHNNIKKIKTTSTWKSL